MKFLTAIAILIVSFIHDGAMWFVELVKACWNKLFKPVVKIVPKALAKAKKRKGKK